MLDLIAPQKQVARPAPTHGAEDEPADPAPTACTLEENQRLSASRLWRWQRQYFEEQGVEAWRRSIVPHYVTCNPVIAAAYARVVFGYLRDLVRESHLGFDATRPLHVLELGAGSGRFTYHFLKKFVPMLQRSALSHLRVKVVMSDFSARNIAFWKQHPMLQDYVSQGWLDFAQVDASDPQDIVLQHSGEVLSAAQPGNPLVVIANYVFDGIEQDAYYVSGGQLHESLVSLHSPQPEPNLRDATLLQRLSTGFAQRPARAQDQYPEPEFNHILQVYQSRLVDTHVLLPTQAMRCITHLRGLCGNRMLLLSADKGVSREEDLLFNGEPKLVHHGSVSLMVNYHALGLYVEQQGGLMMTPPHRPQSLQVIAALFDAQPLTPEHRGALVETCQAYGEHIGEAGPDDFYTLRRFVQANAAELDVPQMLAYLRLSGWDANNFQACYKPLIKCAETMEGPQRREVAAMAAQVWDTYFPLGEEGDMAFALGKLLCEMEHYAEAITHLQRSRQWYGDTVDTLHHIGLCQYHLQQWPQALEHVQHALRVDPAHDPARALLIAIGGQMR
jgi:tetratricopeptide (TPR) repeat protein